MVDRTESLPALLALLSAAAQRRGLNDAQWAAEAGVPKETLSRLRRRKDCDFATLCALAAAAAVRFDVVPLYAIPTTPDGHMPLRMDREYEAHLLRLCASGSRNPDAWCALGPRYFMAGLAVMLASSHENDRNGLLALAEMLHPGSSTPDVFRIWLECSPVRPSRFLPMLRAETAALHAA